MENNNMKNLIKNVLVCILVIIAFVVVAKPTTSVDASVKSNKRVVYRIAKQNYNWGKTQTKYLNKIIKRESGWNRHARNGRYYGLFQTTNVVDRSVSGQARQGLRYIANRYGTPYRAWLHTQRTGWY